MKKNAGTFRARKIGTAAATGKFTLFCDADDALTSDACEKLCLAAKEKNCELLMFSVECIGASPKENQTHEQHCKNIFIREMENPGLLGFYFGLQRESRMSLWGWLFPTALLQKAYRMFPDIYCCSFEDSVILFSVMALCRNAGGIDGKYYRYRRLNGITARSDSFEAAKCVLNAFAKIQGALDGVLDSLESEYCSPEQIRTARHAFLLNQSRYIFNCRLSRPGLSFDEKVELMKYYFDNIDHEAFVYGMACKLNKSQPKEWLNRLDAAGIVPKYIPFKFEPGKTVGLTNNLFFTLGGIERYILVVSRIFLDMGMRVVVISNDEGETANAEFDLPPEVVRCKVSVDFGKRVLQLREIIKRENIDILYAQSYDLVFPDVLTCKIIADIPFITHWHTIFSNKIYNSSDFNWLPALQRKFCDLTICLSPADELFFRSCGAKAKYVLNPPSFKVDEVTPHPHDRPLRTILFVARLHPWVKRPGDVIDIMKNVLRVIPDAKALIVGGATQWFPDEANKLAKRVATEGLKDHVILCGAQTDVGRFYSQADVFLSTSAIEGSPLTIMEALSYGLPIVSYDMPYIVFRSFPDNAIIPVPMFDTRRAALEICRILQHEDLHRKLSDDARRLAEKLSSIDYIEIWKNIFAGLEHGGEDFLSLGEEQARYLPMMMKTLRDHTIAGVTRKLTAEKQKVEKERDVLKKSFSYRLGRAMTWLPRKIQGGMRCVKEHGIKYHIIRFLQKLHIISQR